MTQTPALRLDGWTPARQRLFIETLSQCGSVTKAAETVGLSPSSAYRLRSRKENAHFRMAWEAAMVTALQTLQDSAMERATQGEERPLYSDGRVIGTHRVFDNRLAIFLMQMNGGLRHQAVSFRWNSATRRGHPADELGRLLETMEGEGDPRCELREPGSPAAVPTDAP